MKVRDLLSDPEIPLPIIFECTEVEDYEIQETVSKKQHVTSEYYQTSKLSCRTTSKPLHINKNERQKI
ncbi:hypothetical protein ACHRVW_03890 [Flavobacterium collinsii]|jgi:hypothetical protein|uniref:Uncharacterized protein n=1 Tax=Flavobacterium collinsii TaxID=1114861 RepID=A0A9W4TG80_9FLAO|nr:hypothetical protein [Flavobacterium collinsii]GIQ59312.1 hypothetical protein Flavo103_24480 [Flavobacterium collinsii]CAA9199194.1 hypothetical protein FLACOL7796_02601 [Flavobacterium collinsii]CAI2766460.1 conserved protein of unknown function [Flavobacterium collinsii]